MTCKHIAGKSWVLSPQLEVSDGSIEVLVLAGA